MALDKIETFEHDIASEILKKEASISKVAAADDLVAEVKNEVSPPPKTGLPSSLMLAIIVVVVILLVAGGGYFGYAYYLENKPATLNTQTTKKPQNQANSFASIFPELSADLGRYVGSMEKNPYGYVITFTDYTSVFSYTIKHEDILARSIARALPTGNLIGDSYSFMDVTVSNVNMRIGESGSSTVAYAFVGTNKLIISTSTQGLSSIAGILK